MSATETAKNTLRAREMDPPDNGMDRLTTLPVELIEYISELVHADEPHRYLGLVHRAFLPSSRRRVFKQLYIRDPNELQTLCDLVRLSSVGSHARALVVRSRSEAAWPTEWTILRLFQHFTHLEDLRVYGVDVVASVILKLGKFHAFLPRLRRLRINDPLPSKADDPPLSATEHFQALDNLIHLEEFTFSSLRGLRTGPSCALKTSPLSITGLCLQGSVAGNPAVLALVAACTDLISLHINAIQSAEQPTFEELLEAVQHPETLRDLFLNDFAYQYTAPPPSSRLLCRFPILQRLELHGGAWTSLILDPLLDFSLPHLEHLILGQNLRLTSHALIHTLPSLLSRSLCPSLRRVDLLSLKSRWYCHTSFRKAGYRFFTTLDEEVPVEELRRWVEVARFYAIELTGDVLVQAVEQEEGGYGAVKQSWWI